MRPDYDLMSEIFEAIDEEHFKEFVSAHTYPGDWEKLLYNLELLQDAGYIKGVDIDLSPRAIQPIWIDKARITLKGWEFAEMVMKNTYDSDGYLCN